MTRPHMDRQFAETAHEKQARLRKARAKKAAARDPVTITVLVPPGGKIIKVLGEDANGKPMVFEVI